VFVGNLSYDVTREELIQVFSAAGKVVDAKVPTDRETGKPRGFAFVEFENDEGVQRAVSLLNGQDMKGRSLRVNEAEDRPPRAPGSGPPPRSSGPGGPRPGGFGGPRPGGGFGGPRPGGFGGGPPSAGGDFGDFRKPSRERSRGGDREKRGAFKAKPPEPRRVERRRPRTEGINDDDDFDF
jgi:RNA recognition motif-containing protein